MTEWFFNPCNLVAEFQRTFETSQDPALWVKLVDEETREVEDALAHLLKEMADLEYVIAGLINLVGMEKALALASAGVNRRANLNDCISDKLFDLLPEALRRVHKSNMSKLGEDGKPIRREDGKILKGPNYQPPELLDLITEEYENR